MRNELTENSIAQLDAVDALITGLLDLARSLTYDSKHKLHYHSVALYGSVLETVSGISCLCRATQFTPVPTLLRSLYEAYVDLENLIQEPAYGYTLELEAHAFWQGVLKDAKQAENEHLQSFETLHNLEDHFRDHGRAMRELKKKGAKRLQVKDKFKRANMVAEYTLIYTPLCGHSHNSLPALQERHAVTEGDGYRIHYFRMLSESDIELYLDSCVRIAIRTSAEVHNLLHSGRLDDVEGLTNKVRNVFNLDSE